MSIASWALTWTLASALGGCVPGSAPTGTHGDEHIYGFVHSCAITGSGALKCWGDNTYGQLGDGTTTGRVAPVSVAGLSSGVVNVSFNAAHSCAVTRDGAVTCWGRNDSGQLGDGTTNDSTVPVPVSGLPAGVVAVSVGGAHTCARTQGGAVFCWGRNSDGQLGNGSTVRSATPTPVAGLTSGVSALATGVHSSCAALTGGGVRCWGDNGAGILGTGAPPDADSDVPVAVHGITGKVMSLALTGEHACAVTQDGRAFCWGSNPSGGLGDRTTKASGVPVAVAGLTERVRAVACGDQHSCALLSSGQVSCWGANTDGQLGDGTRTDAAAPVAVRGLVKVTWVFAVGDHTCAGATDGGLRCWGWNKYGQLGNGTHDDSSTPVAVS